jgi:hypothetical protein
MAITSKEINLEQLSAELGNKGLIGDFNDPKKKVILPAEGVEIEESELLEAIANHVAVSKEEQKKELLEKLGITEDEAKLLLS